MICSVMYCNSTIQAMHAMFWHIFPVYLCPFAIPAAVVTVGFGVLLCALLLVRVIAYDRQTHSI